MITNYQFDQPVILKRSPLLSRAIVWGIMGVTAFSLVWASVAKVEESVPATGKLEPQGEVQEIQVPVNGVVKVVHVKDGQRVKPGDLLLTLDTTAAQAQLTSLQKIRTTLMQENQFYRTQMRRADSSTTAQEIIQLKLPTELTSLTKNRSILVAENQLYWAQIKGDSEGINLNPEQQLRLQFIQAEASSRAATAQLDVGQLQQQFNQNQVKLASARDVLAMNQRIFYVMEPVAKQGGVSRIQFLRQQQEVRTRRAEAQQLAQEQKRLTLAIAQSQQKLQNTLALSAQDLLTKASDNEEKIAEIDSQLNKAIVENDKKIAETDSQLSQAKLSLQYQELRAPVSGTVFDMKATTPGFVTNSTEPVLKIVPKDALLAKVFITNKDIGFIKEGMPVDVRIDSFPFSEFGDIKGQLLAIGSDALPPTQIQPVYTFPAKVHLNQQFLPIQGHSVTLQSGMSVSVNIKVRQRTVMSIFTDGFTQQIESLRSVR